MILNTWLTKWYVTFDIWETPLHINTVFVKYNTVFNRKNIIIGSLICFSFRFLSLVQTVWINENFSTQHPWRKPQRWIIKFVSASKTTEIKLFKLVELSRSRTVWPFLGQFFPLRISSLQILFIKTFYDIPKWQTIMVWTYLFWIIFYCIYLDNIFL